MPNSALDGEGTSILIVCDVTTLNSATIKAKSEHFPIDLLKFWFPE